MARRLAAILVLDIVGYSRLMGVDEVGTLDAIKALRTNLIDPAISEHRGRIVKLMGDGALIEFPSIVEAVQCAVEVQSKLAVRNAEIARDKRIDYRMGINLGDVIAEGEDIYGEGVNIASRIESLAKPGGICLSGDAYRQVRGKIDAKFEDAGEHTIKNIAEPVRIWRWIGVGDEKSSGPSGLPGRPVVGRSPVIAVLPFDNLSRDERVDEFAEGLTDEIIVAFSRQTGMTVLARSSTLLFKGKAVSAVEIGLKMGANYVLQGSVRRAGDRIRVAGQLVAADTGNHLWGDQFDGEFANIFALQDEITFSIVAATRYQIHLKDAERIRHVPEIQLTDNELLALASQKMQTLGVDEQREAAQLSGLVVQRNPKNAMALAMSASCVLLEYEYDYKDVPESDSLKAFELINKSIRINEESDYAHFVRGKLLLWIQREHELAIAEAERALELNPNYTYAHALRGFALICCGDFERGTPMIEKVLRANPRHARNIGYFVYLAIGGFLSGDYARAQTWIERAAQRIGYLPYLRILLAVFHAKLEQLEKAHAQVRAVIEAAPAATLSTIKCPPFKSHTDTDRFSRALRQAGFPE